MPLTDIAIRAAKPAEKPFKMSDSGGLYLHVTPTGGKHWRMAYRFAGKQKTLTFGPYPAVRLKDARMRRDAAKALLAEGIDPNEKRKEDARQAVLEAENNFRTVATEWFEMRKAGWTPGYSERMWRRVEADLFPALGDRLIKDIERPELLSVIRRVEARGAIVLAKRIMQVAGQIFRYAVATGRATRDPSQDLRGALRSPGPQKHRAAMKGSELGPFLRSLQTYAGDRQTALALRFTIHTMVRTAEARFATWDEMELDTPMPLWRIPADRMKMRAAHLVPLSPQVVDLLRELKHLAATSPYVFPAPTKERVISSNTMIYSLYRLGYHSRATVHGFRGSASTVLNEAGFDRDWIEKQLAHSDRDEVRAAYNSAEWLQQRRKMLCWWSAYLEAAEKGEQLAPPNFGTPVVWAPQQK